MHTCVCVCTCVRPCFCLCMQRREEKILPIYTQRPQCTTGTPYFYIDFSMLTNNNAHLLFLSSSDTLNDLERKTKRMACEWTRKCFTLTVLSLYLGNTCLPCAVVSWYWQQWCGFKECCRSLYSRVLFLLDVFYYCLLFYLWWILFFLCCV